jgi:hypothetical protein
MSNNNDTHQLCDGCYHIIHCTFCDKDYAMFNNLSNHIDLHSSSEYEYIMNNFDSIINNTTDSFVVLSRGPFKDEIGPPGVSLENEKELQEKFENWYNLLWIGIGNQTQSSCTMGGFVTTIAFDKNSFMCSHCMTGHENEMERIWMH